MCAFRERVDLERHQIGRINRARSAALRLRDAEINHGRDSAQAQAQRARIAALEEDANRRFGEYRQRINALNAENNRYAILVRTADGQEVSLRLADVVRAFPANRLSLTDKLGIYLSRWREFLFDDPREANSEGGVWPAIFGTVMMTIIMSVAVVPFGVLAALYLREYARAGSSCPRCHRGQQPRRRPVDRLRRVRARLLLLPRRRDHRPGLLPVETPQPDLRHRRHPLGLPHPRPAHPPGGHRGDGGILAAVPSSMRDGSSPAAPASGRRSSASSSPRPMPGIMTGMILAMARRGEVAPSCSSAPSNSPPNSRSTPSSFIHPERSFMHLGFHIYDLGFQSQNSEAAKPMVFTTTLLLIFLIAALNLTAIGLRGRLRRKFRSAAF